MDKEKIYAFIDRHRAGVVASVAPGGAPEAAFVYLGVTRELELVFDSTDATRKYSNLRADPRIAVVVGWDNEQTLQIDGVADEPKGAELVRLKKAYFAAWPDGETRQNWPGLTYFRIRPRWLRFSDYNRPRRVEEMTIQGPAKGSGHRLFR